ncbi:hypothetical protein OUZ56_033664 [Daphnia magna]|uniref:CCHC-type domain-containing protein n=1 Tax=Daphnia magna TaxID=35525 RepID=A0ABR0BB04_9CRUS|nr:hypothetical protein OUZ56_033664 [Daphnia magna]
MSGVAGRGRGRQRPRDEFGRFTPRSVQAIVGSASGTLSRLDDVVGEPGGLSEREDRSGVIARGSNLGQHQASISEEETVAWADGEDSFDSESIEGRLEWDFEAFRRRSSVVSARLLRSRASRNSVVAGVVVPLNPVGMAAQIKFQTPPTFTGRDGEDVVSWIHRYEKVGRYNRWGENELRDHIERSLEGAAGKWVDPHMAEATKLAHLWQGLRPSVLEKLWSLKPTNCNEFLQEVKCFQEMTDRGKQDEWAMGVMGREERTQQSPAGQQDASVATRLEKIKKMFEELMQKGDNFNQGRNINRGRDPKATPNWTPDGKPICFRCRQPGHLKQNCQIPMENRQGNGNGGNHRATGDTQRTKPTFLGLLKEESGLSFPLLRSDVTKLVVQDVMCNGRKIPAVIDTGTAVSVCSPGVATLLRLEIKPWLANRLVSINSQKIRPGGAVELEISDGESK